MSKYYYTGKLGTCPICRGEVRIVFANNGGMVIVGDCMNQKPLRQCQNCRRYFKDFYFGQNYGGGGLIEIKVKEGWID